MTARLKFVSLDDERDIDLNGNFTIESLETNLIYTVDLEEQNRREVEIENILEKLIASLPELQRSIIILRFYTESEDRYTAQEIADMLGISRKTYFNHLNKALEKLEHDLLHEPLIRERFGTSM